MKILIRCTMLLLLLIASSVSDIKADFNYSIRLKTRTFLPTGPADPAARSKSLTGKHILIQFENPLTDADKDRLFDAGIELLDYIPNFAFTARLHRSIDRSTVASNGIRWFDGIPATDKISPMITEMGIGDWARRGKDRVQFAIIIHADEDLSVQADRFVSDFDAEIIGFEPSIGSIDLIIPESAYLQLAELDEVLWIEEAMPPPEIHNNSARENTGADLLQAPPFNLTGSGIMVAEWDGGLADYSHFDLAGRVVFGDNASIATHATHVAGTVIGNGTQTILYKGMAPSAQLVSFLWWGSSSELATEYGEALGGHGARISTNSWGLGVGNPNEISCNNLLGNYYSSCATLDNIVAGAISYPVTICWSAGNQRGSSSQYCGSIGWTYGTIGVYGTAKNLITVGAINSDNSTMTSFSSWGPCDDGRIKPDLVGPGCQASGDGGLTSCKLGSGYTTFCGTSMSCPAVAGTSALLLQLYKDTFGFGWPLPSTVKGILINSAEDLGNLGPDYAFGHGKVDGVKAAIKIRIGEPSYLESEISTSVAHIYDMTVPSSATLLRVTLVWDDPGGTAPSGATLINDLDLVLIDPFLSEELPWVLDSLSPFLSATQGVDRTNNVETVGIPNPTPGLWKARVTGFNIPDGPQKYSLIFTPDSIYTPGNLAALAVFDEGDLEQQPGTQATAEFWVTNVGAARDSMTVSIGDNTAWITQTIDTVIALDPWDSSYFSVTIDIPSEAFAGDTDSVFCTVNSLQNPGVTITGNVLVSAGAYYEVSMVAPPDDTVFSPDLVPFTVLIENLGNAFDMVSIQSSDELGWFIFPSQISVTMPPKSDSSVTILASVPYDLLHESTNLISITTTSSSGPADSGSFIYSVYNPYPAPGLIMPSPNTYGQDRSATFVWSGLADSATLYIATDDDFAFLVRDYHNIADSTLTMPVADSLNDGEYYWAVRQYFGTDSTSLQSTPGRFVIDNIVPQTVAPDSPIDGQYVGTPSVLLLFSYGSKNSQSSTTAPEYNILQISQDPTMTTVDTTFNPVPGFSYLLDYGLPEGHWYWRVRRADSAGNIAPYTGVEDFIRDTTSPPVPTQLSPANGAIIDTSVTLKWSSGGTPPAWETAPEYFQLQVYDASFSVILDNKYYVDSAFLSYSLFNNGSLYYWRVKGLDSANHQSIYQSSPFTFTYQVFACGDIDGGNDGTTIADVTFLVAFLFGGGAAPDPYVAGSVDCDQTVDIADLTYLVAYLFNDGLAPCCGS